MKRQEVLIMKVSFAAGVVFLWSPQSCSNSNKFLQYTQAAPQDLL